jgi:hypothetical protein
MTIDLVHSQRTDSRILNHLLPGITSLMHHLAGLSLRTQFWEVAVTLCDDIRDLILSWLQMYSITSN